MKRYICRLMGVYYTIRFGFLDFIDTGTVLLGHNFKYTDKVFSDGWVMECTRCHARAVTDVGPKSKA